MKRTLGKYFPGVVLIALVSIFTPTAAFASATAKASNSTVQSFKSAIFSVAPEATTGGTATGIITRTAPLNTDEFFFYYVNTGTINDTAFNWTVTQTIATGGFTLDFCPINKTYSSPTLCSDNSIPTSMALTGTNGPALTVGQWRPIHIKIKKSGDTFTFASSVSAASQIRAGTNTVA